MAGEIERQDAAHVDALVTDRRKPADHPVGMIAGCQVKHDLEMMGVPGHDDIREQCQGPEMVPSSSVVRPCFAVIMPLWMAR